MSSVAVVGPGRMGVGIALALSVAGRDVQLVDVKDRRVEESEAALERARALVAVGLEQLAAAGFRGSAEPGTVSYRSVAEARDALAVADVVFEAVPETVEAKDWAYGVIGETPAL